MYLFIYYDAIFFQTKLSEYSDIKNHTLTEHGGYLSSEFSASPFFVKITFCAVVQNIFFCRLYWISSSLGDVQGRMIKNDSLLFVFIVRVPVRNRISFSTLSRFRIGSPAYGSGKHLTRLAVMATVFFSSFNVSLNSWSTVIVIWLFASNTLISVKISLSRSTGSETLLFLVYDFQFLWCTLLFT